jgi:uncharacterized membrane protein (DUF441 family)
MLFLMTMVVLGMCCNAASLHFSANALFIVVPEQDQPTASVSYLLPRFDFLHIFSVH